MHLELPFLLVTWCLQRHLATSDFDAAEVQQEDDEREDEQHEEGHHDVEAAHHRRVDAVECPQLHGGAA